MQIFVLAILEVYLFGIGLVNCHAIMQFGMVGFIITVLAACFANIIAIIGIGNFFRYGYCYFHKIDSFPLILYPFILVKKEKKHYKLKVAWDLELLFRIMIPRQVIKEIIKKNLCTEDKCRDTKYFLKSLNVQYTGRIIAIVLLTLVETSWLHSISICLYGLSLIIAQIVLSIEFSGYYVGEQGLRRHLENRDYLVISYMMSQIPMYETGNCEIYLDYENYLEELDEILLCEWTLEALSKMYILDYSGSCEITDKFNRYIQKNISKLDSVQSASTLWYFLTLHMNWALAKRSEDDVFQFLLLVRKMKKEYEDVLSWLKRTKRVNFFTWHINVAQNQIIEVNRFGRARFHMLKRDYLCAVSQKYKEYYSHLTQDVWELCEKSVIDK